MAQETKKLSVIQNVALSLIPEDKRKAVQALLLSEEKEVKLEEMILEDGTTRIMADSFEPGEAVFIVADGDERIPAPEGEHKLEDGRVLVLDAEGKIVEIRAAEGAAEEEEMSKDDMASVLKRLEALETKLSESEALAAAKETEAKEATEALEKVQEELTKLSAEPADTPPVPSPVAKKVEMSAQEERVFLANCSPKERALYEFEKRQN